MAVGQREGTTDWLRDIRLLFLLGALCWVALAAGWFVLAVLSWNLGGVVIAFCYLVVAALWVLGPRSFRLVVGPTAVDSRWFWRRSVVPREDIVDVEVELRGDRQPVTLDLDLPHWQFQRVHLVTRDRGRVRIPFPGAAWTAPGRRSRLVQFKLALLPASLG